MKIWKAEQVEGGCAPYFLEILEQKLNELQRMGREIKVVYPLVLNGFTRSVQIIYTEEDATEE